MDTSRPLKTLATPTITPRYLSLQDASWVYGTSRSSLYRRDKSGHFLVRHGARTRVDVQLADAYHLKLSEKCKERLH
ncbi:hypothetical protein SAMN05444161_3877 [Rhizobiales bacterium GAS191]|nr:hypothetical protein SAMN05444161_3877 [Rhizobiales bacterium GAS191]